MLKRCVVLITVVMVLFAPQMNASVGAEKPDLRGSVEIEDFFNELMTRVSRDRLSAPQASRLYAYVASAMLIASTPEEDVLRRKMNAAPVVQKSGEKIDPVIAALAAGSSVARNLLLVRAAKLTLGERRDQVLHSTVGELPRSEVAQSIAFGVAVSDAVIARAKEDGFEEAKAISPPESKSPGEWVPTQPGFQPAINPGWGTLKLFLVDSRDCVLPPPPLSGEASSPFQGAAEEVAAVAKNLTEEQKDIARFWDDSRGRTATPSGHWLGIALAASKNFQSSAQETIKTIAHTMMAVADTFILTWKFKYLYMVERPITTLQRSDPSWSSYIGTPAFPEYPSGHSGISRTAADVLDSYFGEWKFTDPGYGMTDKSRGSFNLSPRTFASFNEAAKEASISRMYGGIHFTIGLTSGAALGACVARKTL